MADAKTKPNLFGYRIGRRSYWIYLAVLILVSFALSFVLPTATSGTAFVWFLIYAWRLHDFGRSAWWAGGLMLALLIVGVGGIVAAHAAAGAMGETFDLLSAGVIALLILMQAAFTIWVGAVRGDDGPNRFGVRTEYKIGRFTI